MADTTIQEASQRLVRALGHLGICFDAVQPLAGDVSSRRYFRVWDRDTTLVACLYPEPFDETETARQRWLRLCQADPTTRLGFASDPLAYIEVSGWLAQSAIPVPSIRGIAGAYGCIVTDDVGDRSLERELLKADAAAKHRLYGIAMEHIRRLQLTTAQAHRRRLVACSLRLDAEKLDHEIDYLARALRSFLPEQFGTGIPARLRREWSAIAAEAADDRMVLCHRDYHARNLFLRGDTLVVIDHQDMRLGSPHYDAASLVWDPYVDLPGELRERLMPLAFTDLRVAAVVCQRLLKALGTYLHVLTTRPKSVFVSAASRALSNLKASLSHAAVSMEETESVIDRIHAVLRTRYGVLDEGGGRPNAEDKE